MRTNKQPFEWSEIAKREMGILDAANMPYPKIVPESWKKNLNVQVVIPKRCNGKYIYTASLMIEGGYKVDSYTCGECNNIIALYAIETVEQCCHQLIISTKCINDEN